MVYKSLYVKLCLRVSLIVAEIFALHYVWQQASWYMAQVISIVLLAGMLVELIFFLGRSSREFTGYLEAIRNGDYTQKMNLDTSASNKHLFQSAELLRKDLYNIRLEREMHFQYLKNIIQELDLPLFCFHENGKLILDNPAAIKLFGRKFKHKEELKEAFEQIHEALLYEESGKAKLIKIVLNKELMQLSVKGTRFVQEGIRYECWFIQNIRNELESQELNSYQALIKTLTHEIMNSVTPISSLSEAYSEQLYNNGDILSCADLDQEDLDELAYSLHTISSRSKSLLRFVKLYKDLNRIPKPQAESIDLKQFSQRLQSLFAEIVKDDSVTLKYEENLTCATYSFDVGLMEQVLINIMLNAVEASEGKENGWIRFQLDCTNKGLRFVCEDTGKGMSAENMENAFVPFYTSKAKGSGIGLSLSRQIVRLHEGRIQLKSEQGKGTQVCVEI